MKKTADLRFLFPLTPLLGLAGLGLRVWLYSLKDTVGLLPAGHISSILTAALTAALLALLIVYTRRFPRDGGYARRFPRSILGGLGCIAAAAGICVFALAESVTVADAIAKLCLYLGIAAALALLVCAIFRFRGKTPPFLAYVAVCVYLMLHAVSQCRTWGAQSQVITYCFQLLASVCLMLFAYHRTAAIIDKADYRWLLFTQLASVYFCMVSLNTENRIFYLALGLWSLLDGCALQEK